MENFGGCTVASRTEITPELSVFTIVPDTPIEFTPGQCVRLAAEIGGRAIVRPYSIASAPHERELEFFVERAGECVGTPLLWGLKEGDRLLMHRVAEGVFVLDRAAGCSRYVMLATATGIAPFLSIIRSHDHAQMYGRADDLHILLIHGATNAAALAYYADEIASNYGDWLIYIPTISQPQSEPLWSGEVGRVSELIRKYTDMLGYDYLNSIAYLCGDAGMTTEARGVLERARFPGNRIHVENCHMPHAAT